MNTVPPAVSTTHNSPSEQLDAVIVGAGLSGLYHLHLLRQLGLSIKIFEAAPDVGGTWYWNCYPGARTDSDHIMYQFSMEELWKDWSSKQRFPGRNEVYSYLKYVIQKLDLRRDIRLNTRVASAKFDTQDDRWVITTDEGTIIHARVLVLCTGFASKPYIPELKGLETFKGIWHHTSRWPQEDVPLSGKRVAVIGTGASAVQVIQESAPVVSHLTVFQRTPNIALPMGQREIDAISQAKMKQRLYPICFRRRTQTSTGLHVHSKGLSSDATPEERWLLYENMWSNGSLDFVLGLYQDVATNQAVNDEVYAFWRDKVIARIVDPSTQEKLAPKVPPHPIGTKRPSLEISYYEAFNQPNVSLIDVNDNPIIEITPKGVKTGDGVEHEIDVLVFATGFDAASGSMTQIGLVGTDGVALHDKWAKGIRTYLGMTTANFPNMFFPYGPQSPGPLANAHSCIVSF